MANGSAILEFTSGGSLIRTLQFPGVTHLSLATDGNGFYAAGVVLDQADFRHFDPSFGWETIPLGNPEMQSAAVPLNVDDLVTVGEWRAGSASGKLRSVRRR